MPAPRAQDILKVFDYETTVDDPYLSVREVTSGLAEHFDIRAPTDAVWFRLNQMVNDGLVARRRVGSSVTYRALVAPEVSDELKAELADRKQTPVEDSVPHDDLWERLDGRS